MPEREVDVEEVKAFKTQSGNTRFVLRADDGSEYTTFKEAIARDAVAAEGKRARIEFHEQERNGARTQGAPIVLLSARPRTRRCAAERGRATQSLIA